MKAKQLIERVATGESVAAVLNEAAEELPKGDVWDAINTAVRGRMKADDLIKEIGDAVPEGILIVIATMAKQWSTADFKKHLMPYLNLK